jgi:ABC-2 type transport system permease protein
MVDFVIPGMLGVAMLWLGLFGTAMPLVALREQHVLRRLGATPLSRGTLLASQVSWRLTVGLAQAPVFLVFGHFAFGLAVSGSPLLLALAVVLGTLVFVTMGYLLAGLSPSQEGATAITQLVNFPMMMLSGAFFEIELLPSFLRPIVDVLPLTYLGDALRQIMAGFPPLHPLWLDFAVLAGWLLAMAAISLRVFRWE